MVFFSYSHVVFESTLLSFSKPQSKLDIPTLRQGSREGKQKEKEAEKKAEDLGSNSSECHVLNLFRCVLSFSATLTKRWKVQFRLRFAKTEQC